MGSRVAPENEKAEGVDATVLHVAEEQGGMQANGAAGNGDSHASVENGSTRSGKGLGVFSMSAKFVHKLMRKPAAAPEAAPSGIDFADHAAFMRQERARREGPHMGRAKGLFISHCWRNTDVEVQSRKREIVSSISAPRTEGGCDAAYWADWLDLQASGPVPWRKEIEDGIADCAKMVCFLDFQYLRSFNCLQEVAYAIKYEKPVVIIMQDQGAFDLLTKPDGADRAWDEAAAVGGAPPLSAFKGQDFLPGEQFSHEVVRTLFRFLSDINICFARTLDYETRGKDSIMEQTVEFVNKDLSYLKTYAQLLTHAREWDLNGRPASGLLGFQALEAAQKWLDDAGERGSSPKPHELHRALVATSRNAARRRSGLLRGAAAIVVLIIICGAALSAALAAEASAAELKARLALGSANVATALATAALANATASAARAAEAQMETLRQVARTEISLLESKSTIIADSAPQLSAQLACEASRRRLSYVNESDKRIFYATQATASKAVLASSQQVYVPSSMTALNSHPEDGDFSLPVSTVVAVFPDGSAVATGEYTGVALFALPSLERIATLPTTAMAAVLAVSPDGRYIVAAPLAAPGLWPLLAIWDKFASGGSAFDGPPTYTVDLSSFAASPTPFNVTAVAWAPDSTSVYFTVPVMEKDPYKYPGFAAYKQEALGSMDILTRLVTVLRTGLGASGLLCDVTAVSVGADGSIAAVCAYNPDCKILWWSPADADAARRGGGGGATACAPGPNPPHQGALIAISPDGQRIALSAAEGTYPTYSPYAILIYGVASSASGLGLYQQASSNGDLRYLPYSASTVPSALAWAPPFISGAAAAQRWRWLAVSTGDLAGSMFVYDVDGIMYPGPVSSQQLRCRRTSPP